MLKHLSLVRDIASGLLVAGFTGTLVYGIHHIGYIAGSSYERASPGGCCSEIGPLKDAERECERKLSLVGENEKKLQEMLIETQGSLESCEYTYKKLDSGFIDCIEVRNTCMEQKLGELRQTCRHGMETTLMLKRILEK